MTTCAKQQTLTPAEERRLSLSVAAILAGYVMFFAFFALSFATTLLTSIALLVAGNVGIAVLDNSGISNQDSQFTTGPFKRLAPVVDTTRFIGLLIAITYTFSKLIVAVFPFVAIAVLACILF